MRKLIFITVMCAFITAPASADLMFVEDYIEGNSWTPGAFIAESIGDHIQMMVSVPGGLEDPSLSSYGSPGLSGWIETYNDETIAIWDRAVANKPGFYVWFDDALKTQTFYWYIQCYNNGQLTAKDDNWVKFTNKKLVGIGGPPSGWNPGYIVPVPGAVLLGIIGLGMAGAKLRRKKNV